MTELRKFAKLQIAKIPIVLEGNDSFFCPYVTGSLTNFSASWLT